MLSVLCVIVNAMEITKGTLIIFKEFNKDNFFLYKISDQIEKHQSQKMKCRTYKHDY